MSQRLETCFSWQRDYGSASGEILTLDLIQKTAVQESDSGPPSGPTTVGFLRGDSAKNSQRSTQWIQRFQRFGLGEDGQRFKMRITTDS